ncbi:MAG: hypothetical protein BWK79_00870 [Beggiatoa sp. IS2]|nr:MAG: hypothetical protein BWK79_00870 [Beggiatoa sp. IS2]
MKLLFVLFLASTLTATGYAAESYKWVDAEGNVQYSQTPPPQGVEEVEKVELAPPVESKPLEEQASGDVVENPSQPAVTDPTKKPESASEEMQAIKKKNCDSARTELDKVGTANAQIVVEDKENPGKYVPLSEEERKQHAEKAQAYLDAFCKE